MTYTFCAPFGIEFSLDDEEPEFKDDFGEDETYDSHPTDGGFLKNLKSSEQQELREAQREFDEYDVDVDVGHDSEEEEQEDDDDL